MNVRRSIHRRLTAWIATIAILFGVFSPVLGHALAQESGRSVQYLAVCTSTGVQYIELDVGGSGDNPAGSHQVQSECAWCFSHIHLAGMPEAEHQHDFTRPGSLDFQSVANTTPRFGFAWSVSLARGPPSSI